MLGQRDANGLRASRTVSSSFSPKPVKSSPSILNQTTGRPVSDKRADVTGPGFQTVANGPIFSGYIFFFFSKVVANV